MIKVFYGSKIDAVNWKIYLENSSKSIFYFPTSSTPNDVANKLCQFSLFDVIDNDSSSKENVNIVDITEWKLSNDVTQEIIEDLHSLNSLVIFAIESSTFKNKLFTELKIETIKCNAVTRSSKEQVVKFMLNKAKIKLDFELEQLLIDLLPENINFIKNEIKKLQQSGITNFSEDQIRKIIFNAGDATIFNIIESWLNNDKNQLVQRINELLASNYLVADIIPIFAYSLVQLKFYLKAKLAKWSTSEIAERQGLQFWQQNKYVNLKPYNETLTKVDDMLSKFYNFDINIKKQKNIPYSQLIKILFE